MLATTRTVIVDEIHALAPNKRGSHLALSLERLDALDCSAATRIGLSATQKPIDEIARFLVGARVPAEGCTIVDTGHVRDRDLALEVPPSPLEAVMSGDVWQQVYARLAELTQAASHDARVRQHATDGRARGAAPFGPDSARTSSRRTTEVSPRSGVLRPSNA